MLNIDPCGIMRGPDGVEYKIWHVGFNTSKPHWLLAFVGGQWILWQTFETADEALTAWRARLYTFYTEAYNVE